VPRKFTVPETERDRHLVKWATDTGVDLAKLDAGQQWVIYAALTFLTFIKGVAPLRRMVAYLLCHCGMGLSTSVIGAVVGTTDRAVRNSQQFKPPDFWKRLRILRRGHAPPKLRRVHVGQVAKYLAEHPKCLVADVLSFLAEKLLVKIDRLTLRRFLKRYGLGCLREHEVQDTPFLPAAPSTAGPFS
jgi:transposase